MGKFSLVSFVCLTFGTSTSRPNSITCAVSIKIISRTRTTSTSGTTLISDNVPAPRKRPREELLPREEKAMRVYQSLLFKSPLRQIKKLQRKILHPRPKLLNRASKPVKKNRRRNSRRQPQRGGDQRFRNARRTGAQAGATRRSKTLKSVDDPPNRAEQANKWRHCGGGREQDHVAFQACDFLA